MLLPKLRRSLNTSPGIVRVVPFLLFFLLTALQGQWGPESGYWIYVVKTVLGGWMIWVVWPMIKELRWSFDWVAVAVGIGVFVIWVGLDGRYPTLTDLFGGESEPWNPHLIFGEGTYWAWFFIVCRCFGSILVVPILEETAFRSVIYRYVIDVDFMKVSLRRFHWPALLVASGIFALEHDRWLAGFVCGLAYQWLVMRKGHLGGAVCAHAVTNALLAAWVLLRNDWNFW